MNDLPPLPEPSGQRASLKDGRWVYDPAETARFNDLDMKAYAILAVQAERERCACIAEGASFDWDKEAYEVFGKIAEAIRAGR